MVDSVASGLQTGLEEILELQEAWEPGGMNTPAMDRRGVLIRSTVPSLLRAFIDNARPARGLAAEGSDGAGRKARIPWVRLYSSEHSPKASDGWYLVYLFSADGKRVYLSLNQGTTVASAGYRGRDESFLRERVEWAKGHLISELASLDAIQLGEGTPLARGYEAGHVAGAAYERGAVPADDRLSADLLVMIEALDAIYRAEDALASLPAGYGPGEPLFGFTTPVPYTLEEVAAAPEDAGVHVVWSGDGELLFAGLSKRLRERMRGHLQSDREGSILREKVGRRLSQELGREPSGDEITAYLNRASIAWRAVAATNELKARIMDELRPTFNDVRPKTEAADAKVLAVYVGREAEANLQAGLEARTWGFKEARPDHEQIGVGDWIVLASRYTDGNVRTSEESWASHGVERLILGRVVRALFHSDEPLWPDEKLGNASYPNRIEFEIVDNVVPLDFGSGVIGPDVVDALRHSAINRGLGYVAPAVGTLFGKGVSAPVGSGPVDADLAQVCLDFGQALETANLHFGADHDGFVRAFVASLATKRLVLLTGLSGSGKTRIALGFGQWLGSGRYKVIAVRPDWTGPEPLLGYEDALLPSEGGRRAWNAPEALRFMLDAARHPGQPYLLVLDEMNLAHVERYFADLLSGMESNEPVLPNLVEEDGYWRLPKGADEKLPFPRNLFIAGTVNVDETTYLFSPKVLDRANTLEFRVESGDLRVDALPPGTLSPGPGALSAGFGVIAADQHWQAKHPATNRELVAEKLTDLHGVLSQYGFEFGHRVFFEALRFASLLEAAGEAGQWAGLDLQVLQKVLPRLHGSTKRLSEPLSAVARFALDLTTLPVGGSHVFDVEAVDAGTAALRLSFEKSRRMLRSLRVNQFASFSE